MYGPGEGGVYGLYFDLVFPRPEKAVFTAQVDEGIKFFLAEAEPVCQLFIVVIDKADFTIGADDY